MATADKILKILGYLSAGNASEWCNIYTFIKDKASYKGIYSVTKIKSVRKNRYCWWNVKIFTLFFDRVADNNCIDKFSWYSTARYRKETEDLCHKFGSLVKDIKNW